MASWLFVRLLFSAYTGEHRQGRLIADTRYDRGTYFARSGRQKWGRISERARKLLFCFRISGASPVLSSLCQVRRGSSLGVHGSATAATASNRSISPLIAGVQRWKGVFVRLCPSSSSLVDCAICYTFTTLDQDVTQPPRYVQRLPLTSLIEVAQ